MHYGNRAFAKNGSLSTIKVVQQTDGYRPIINRRYALSQGDIAGANRLYNCRSLYHLTLNPCEIILVNRNNHDLCSLVCFPEEIII